MTSAQYKKICQSPETICRAVIEATARSLPDGSQIRAKLQEITRQNPTDKPPFHDGYRGADMFIVELTREQIAELTEVLLSLEAELVEQENKEISYPIHAADLVDVWGNYEEFKIEQQSSGDLAARKDKISDRLRAKLRDDFDALMSERRDQTPVEGDELPDDLR